jgi:nucleotide-binding universal stress UspA family protein
VGGLGLAIYRPLSRECLMYFNSVVTIELDKSYLSFPETAEAHLREILDGGGVPWRFVEPAAFTATELPDLPVDWALMSCPRVISESVQRIGLTHIGPKVRAIIKHATFPVFIPAACYKEWNRVAAFFGGSELGLHAVRIAMRIAHHAQAPLTIYTQLSDALERERLREMLRRESFPVNGEAPDRQWVVFESGSLEENLYAVPGDSLAVIGAAGEKSIRRLLFGGRLEIVQSTLPNPLLIIGPNCGAAFETAIGRQRMPQSYSLLPARRSA